MLFVIIDDPVLAAVAPGTKNRKIAQFVNLILQNVQNLILMKDESQVLELWVMKQMRQLMPTVY